MVMAICRLIYHFELCVFNFKNLQIQILNWKYFEFYLNLNVDLMAGQFVEHRDQTALRTFTVWFIK